MTERLVVVLKSRQIGLSWLAAAWVLWNCLTKDGATWLLFSKGEAEAMGLVDKCHSMYNHLPKWMQLKKDPDSRTELGFPAKGSVIKAFGSTQSAGVSWTASGIVCDEWEYHPFAEYNYTNAKPTIDAGGQMIGIFTTDKTNPETLAKKIYKGARKGINGFVPLFFPYQEQ